MGDSTAVLEARTPVRRRTSPHRFVGPGEAEFAAWCAGQGIVISYEPYLYELGTEVAMDESGRIYHRVTRGFSPDFLVHAAADWPELHVEVTITQRPWKKLGKIRDTAEHYQVQTFLLMVGSRRWRQIKRDPSRLRDLLTSFGRRIQAAQSH